MCVLTKLVVLSLVVAALMPRGKLESCDGWLVLRCSEKSSSTSKMPRLQRVEPCAPGPQYRTLVARHSIIEGIRDSARAISHDSFQASFISSFETIKISFHGYHYVFCIDSLIRFSIVDSSNYKRRVLLANYKIRLSMDGIQSRHQFPLLRSLDSSYPQHRNRHAG